MTEIVSLEKKWWINPKHINPPYALEEFLLFWLASNDCIHYCVSVFLGANELCKWLYRIVFAKIAIKTEYNNTLWNIDVISMEISAFFHMVK